MASSLFPKKMRGQASPGEARPPAAPACVFRQGSARSRAGSPSSAELSRGLLGSSSRPHGTPSLASANPENWAPPGFVRLCFVCARSCALSPSLFCRSSASWGSRFARELQVASVSGAGPVDSRMRRAALLEHLHLACADEGSSFLDLLVAGEMWAVVVLPATSGCWGRAESLSLRPEVLSR